MSYYKLTNQKLSFKNKLLRSLMIFIFFTLPSKISKIFVTLNILAFIYYLNNRKLNMDNINKENMYKFFHTYISEDILLLPNFTYNWIFDEEFLYKEIYINKNKYYIKDIITNENLIKENKEIIIDNFLDQLPKLLKIKLHLKDQIERYRLRKQISNVLVFP